MLRTAPLCPLCQELQRGPALWVKSMLLVHNGCQDAVAADLETHGGFETLRRELREWTSDDADRILA